MADFSLDDILNEAKALRSSNSSYSFGFASSDQGKDKEPTPPPVKKAEPEEGILSAIPVKKPAAESAELPEASHTLDRAAKVKSFSVTLPAEAVSKPSPFERKRLEDEAAQSNAVRKTEDISPEPEEVKIAEPAKKGTLLEQVKKENSFDGGFGAPQYSGDTIHAAPVIKTNTGTLPEREGETIHAASLKETHVSVRIPAAGPVPENIPGQQTFSGYEPAAPDKEAELRSELADSRRKKVREFVLADSVTEDYEETEESDGEGDEDYRSYDDAKKIKYDLLSRIRIQKRSLWLTALFTLLMLAVTVLGRMGKLGELFSPEGNPGVFICVIGILFVCTVLVNASSIFGGLGALLRFKPDVDSPVGLAALLTAAQTVLFAVMPEQFNSLKSELLVGAFGVALIFNIIGKLSMLKRINRNFRLIANRKSKKYSALASEKDAELFGRGISVAPPTVSCDCEATDLQNFLSYSYDGCPTDPPAEKSAWVILPAAAAAILLTVFLGNHESSAAWILSSVTWMVLFASPFAALMSGSAPLARTSRSLEKHGAMLAGYEAAELFSSPDILAVDAAELFPKGTVQLCSVKVYGSKPIDDVLLSAAGVAINAGGPLAPVFETVISGKNGMLPEVDSLVFEAGMGVSGWVNNDRVLVGNSLLLKNHGVRVLDPRTENELCEGDKHLLYLSCEGELSAVFVLRYLSDERAGIRLRAAVKRGMRLLVSSCDQNVTPELVSQCYEIPVQAIGMMDQTARRVYADYTKPTQKGDALLVNGGTLYSRLMALLACRRLLAAEKSAAVMTVTAMILGILISGAMIWMGWSGNVLYAILWQVVSAVICRLIPSVIRPD